MPIHDTLVLAADVSIVPVRKVSPRLRVRLGAKRDDYVLTRLRGRTPARLIGRLAASLLREFLEPCLVADAVIACASTHRIEPDALLEEAFPLLHDVFNGRFLVEAGSAEASRTLPSRDRGDRIGRFEVLRCLQVIVDSELYQARDGDGSLVAIKLARPGLNSGTLFSREAAALRQLRGTGVPRLVAAGRHEGRPWLAMSWCSGIAPQIVFAELRLGGSIHDQRRMLKLAERIARAYGQIHRAGVVHGDVHPENLLVDQQRNVMVVDFGLADAIPPLRLGGRTRRGAVPQFLAPEQASAMLATGLLPRPSVASEQYSVATLLYILLAGAHPLELSLDRTTMLRQIVSDAPLPFARRGLRSWPALEAVLQRALAKQPGDRFKSLDALSRALTAVRCEETSSTPRCSVAAGPALDHVVASFVERVDYDAKAFRHAGRAPTASVMLGRAGVAYALYRLSCLQDDAHLLSLADAWLVRIERDAASDTSFAAPADGLDFEGLGPVSPFHSITGLHLTRTLISLASGDFLRAATAIEQFATVAETPWSRIDLTLGRGGVPHACALLLDALPASMTESRARVRALGGRTLDELWSELAGMQPIGAQCEFDGFGIAHGWAGLIHASLRWREATGESVPGGLPNRLAQLARTAEPVGRGVHWPQHKVGPTASVLANHEVAGWCNGPAGFVHLWTRADVHYPGMHHDELAELSAWTAWEARGELFDLCCGLTGRAFAMLSMFRHTGREEWLDRANQLGARAAAAFTRHRLALPRPLSLFKGEPGLALLAAELRRPESSAFPLFESEGFPRQATHG